MTPERASLAITVGAACLYAAAERVWPQDRQKLLRPGFFTDLVMYGIVQSLALGAVIGALLPLIDAATGLSKLHLLAGWSLGAKVAFFFVTHDFYIYWFHRAQHHHPMLWRLHEAHHSVKDVDWVAGSRSHPLEIVINQTIEFAPIYCLGGTPAEVAMLAAIKAALDAVWGMFIHANLDVNLGALGYVLNGPEQHRWHHARDVGVESRNYGTKLAIWDWMFGTLFRPGVHPKSYGLMDDGYPDHGAFAWFQQTWFSFLPSRLRFHGKPFLAPRGGPIVLPQ